MKHEPSPHDHDSAKPRATAPELTTVPGGAPGTLRLLVVDDEPVIRGVITQVLRLDGHEATEVSSGEVALAAFKARPFPVVITDIVMGGMTGLQLLQEIKSIDPETVVIIMTSQASFENATAALRFGAYDFLSKPFEDLVMISAAAKRAQEHLGLLARNRLLTSQLEMYTGELERLNASLKSVATLDWLTGLPNRRQLHTQLDSEIWRSRRHGHTFAIVMADVDYFKSYNDKHGHLAGDEVLRSVGELLRSSGRAEHVCARYGGEEFAVIMPETDLEAARIWAERIRHQFESHPFENRETQPGGRLTVSMGIACFPADGADGDSLLSKADEALYRAKALGRNRVES